MVECSDANQQDPHCEQTDKDIENDASLFPPTRAPARPRKFLTVALSVAEATPAPSFQKRDSSATQSVAFLLIFFLILVPVFGLIFPPACNLNSNPNQHQRGSTFRFPGTTATLEIPPPPIFGSSCKTSTNSKPTNQFQMTRHSHRQP